MLVSGRVLFGKLEKTMSLESVALMGILLETRDKIRDEDPAR